MKLKTSFVELRVRVGDLSNLSCVLKSRTVESEDLSKPNISRSRRPIKIELRIKVEPRLGVEDLSKSRPIVAGDPSKLKTSFVELRVEVKDLAKLSCVLGPKTYQS